MGRVIHFEIQADDVQRAKAFYEKTFGWQVQQWMKAEEGGMDYWGLITGADNKHGINGGLYQRPANDKLHTYDCTIEVENLDESIAAVQKNGGTITKPKAEIPGVGWFAGGVDTEGNRFGMMQSTRKE